MDKIEQEFQYKSKTYRRQYMDKLQELYRSVDDANTEIGKSAVKNAKDGMYANNSNRRSGSG
jgi:predicted nucleotidyltransferase